MDKISLVILFLQRICYQNFTRCCHSSIWLVCIFFFHYLAENCQVSSILILEAIFYTHNRVQISHSKVKLTTSNINCTNKWLILIVNDALVWLSLKVFKFLLLRMFSDKLILTFDLLWPWIIIIVKISNLLLFNYVNKKNIR